MTRYLVQPRDHRIFVKGYWFFIFAKNMGKNIYKNISENVRGKYSPDRLATCQKLLDHAKQSATNMFKTASKRAIQRTEEATGDLIGRKKLLIKLRRFHKINNKIIQKQLQTVTNESDNKLPKKRCIYIYKRNVYDNKKTNITC